jgi:hypothetical protein
METKRQKEQKERKKEKAERPVLGFPEKQPGVNRRASSFESKFPRANFPSRILRGAEKSSRSRSRKRERENHGVYFVFVIIHL